MHHSLKTFRLFRSLLLVLVIPLLLAACNAQGQSSGVFASLPAGKAYAEGKEIFFVHTEASDPDIATTLTEMMRSPVLHVPALAQVPAEALADVYVFENGVSGDGPLGFQADVFSDPPGTPGYSPLRQIILVRWVDGAAPAELKSIAEIAQAEAVGSLLTSPTGVVVNMPFVVWDGGRR